MMIEVKIVIIWIVISYLFGSIPWALIIGKVFFNKDIREYGSHNLGGTNAARVLGLPYGIAVILLDGLKALIFILIGKHFNVENIGFIALFTCIGHCYPIFADFKGGKAVATSFGYLFGLSVLFKNALIFLLPFLFFIVILLIFKMISLASMSSLVLASIYLLFIDFKIAIVFIILTLFIIYRHRTNIQRILNNTESKINLKR